MDTEKPRIYKPRALFIYDAESELTEAHPLWHSTMLYAENMEELHIIVLTKNVERKEKVVTLRDNVFVYYIPSRFLFFRLQRLWSLIRFELVWQHSFRADVIVSWTTGIGAYIGYILKRLYQKKYIVHTSGSFLELSRLSAEYMRMRFLSKRADLIVVPGETVKHTLEEAMHTKARVVSITPPLELPKVGMHREVYNYALAYPDHSMFILSRLTIGRQKEFLQLVRVFKHILVAYPKAALILITPHAHVGPFKRLVWLYRMKKHIFVHEEKGDLAYLYGGGHVYVSMSQTEEINMPMLTALGLHIPVVTTPTGMARELFSGSRYESFMCSYGDVSCFYTMIKRLIEDQYIRDEYRLNTNLILQKLSVQTPDGYVNTFFAHLQSLL